MPAPEGPHGSTPAEPTSVPTPPGVGAPTPPRPPSGGPPHDGSPPPSVQRNRRGRNVGWRSRDVLRTAALVIFMYLMLRLLWFAQVLVFTIFLGVLFGLAVASGVDRLQRFRIPRGIGAALIVFGTLGLLGGFGAWAAPTLREQSAELRTKLPEAAAKIEQWIERRRGGLLGTLLQAGGTTADVTSTAARSAATAATGNAPPAGSAGARIGAPPATRPDSLPAAPTQPAATAPAPVTGTQTASAPGGIRERVLEQMSGARRFVFGFITSTVAALGGILLVIFLAVYVAIEPHTYHDGLMHLFPYGARRRAGEVLTAIAVALRKWLQTQLIAMLVIGGVTTIALLLLGVKAALPLGILAGLLEFIPTIGPILSAVPAIAMGFVDSPEKALWVALAYVGIQFLENHILIPILMKEGVDLPPAMTIIAQALMALVFGFLGLLVAVPMLAATTVAVKMLYVQDVVGDPVEALDSGDEDD